MKIVRAKKEDVAELVSFIYSFYKKTMWAEKDFTYDPEYVTELFLALVDSGIVQVAKDEGKIVGCIVVIVSPIPFSLAYKTAVELVFYVNPAYQGQGTGTRLLKQAENVAKQQGVKLFSMVHLEGVDPDKPESLYKSFGYEKSETIFTKEL